MSAATDRVVEAARALGLEIEVKTFPEGTRTADDAARAIGCDVAQIVKSLVFMAGDRAVIAYVSGRHKLDTAKLARAAGVDHVRKATADEARDATGFAIGGTPPFGHATPLLLFMDATLLGFDEIWAAAGTPQTVFALTPEDLLKASDAQVEDLHEEGRGNP